MNHKEQYIKKSEVVAEIEKRIKGLKDCRADRVAGYAGEISGLERLLSFLNTLETKEVNLEKEVDSQMDLLCNLLCYMDELSNGDSEGIYPLPEKVIEDLQRFARHFFELGLRSFITEESCKLIWEPSDKQMKALSAMKRYCEIATSFDAYKQEVVESLYQDLKKLKEGR